MRIKSDDVLKKRFEADFMRAFSALTKLPQVVALRVAREHVETVLAMYNEEYSAKEAASFVVSVIDVDEIKKGALGVPASAGWR